MPAMKWVPEMPDAAGAGGEVDARRRAVADAFAAGGPLSAAVAGFSPRSAQQEMALAVFDAIATRSTLVAEAGTGTGKTMAYLVPALLAGGKVLVCAGTKTLQDQIFGIVLVVVLLLVVAALGIPGPFPRMSAGMSTCMAGNI